MGGRELLAPAGREPPLGYHSSNVETLTTRHELGVGQCQVDSLTGAVASEKVSEALKGCLRMVGNHSKSVKAEGSLTVTATVGAGTKVGLSDPVVESGIAIAQRIKATLGITGLSLPVLATRPCHWHDNRSTSGRSIPVLSY